MQKKNSPSYYPQLSGIRILAVMAVVLLHGLTYALPVYPIGQWQWWIVSSVDAISRWAVPVFVMVSGALLLNPEKQESFPSFMRKRFYKIGIPLLFWSIAYYLWMVFRGNAVPFSEQLIHSIVNGRPYFHLYFLFLIGGLYFITPVLRLFLAHASRKLQRYLIWITIGMASVGTFFDMWFRNHWYFGSVTAISYWVPYVGYFLLGHYLIRVSKRHFYAWLMTSLILGGFLMTVLGRYLLTIQYGQSSRGIVLVDNLSPSVISLSIGVFLICFYKLSKVKQWVKALDPYAFGIYLVHPMVMEALNDFSFSIETSLTSLWVLIFLTFIMSLSLTVILSKIPLLNRTIGLR